MGRTERDPLRALDWSKVYADVPDAVNDGVRMALLRVRERQRRRARALRWATACAACALLVVGATALLSRDDMRAPDRVAAPSPGAALSRACDAADMRGMAAPSPGALALGAYDEVYASRADEYFHVTRNCPRAADESVALKVITALEFEKALCPECGAGYAVAATDAGKGDP